MNIDVNNSGSIKKLVNLVSKTLDIQIVRDRVKRYTDREDEINLIGEYYRLVVNTNYLRTEAYEFLVNGKTYNQIIQEYDVNPGYIRNIIYNEGKRLFTEIGGDPLGELRLKELTEEKTAMYTKNIKTILGTVEEKGGNSINDLFTFNIEETSEVDRKFNRNVGEQDFKELVTVLKYFVKPYADVLVENIDKRHIGYILYLLRTDEGSLTEQDKLRKKYLKMEWMLK